MGEGERPVGTNQETARVPVRHTGPVKMRSKAAETGRNLVLPEVRKRGTGVTASREQGFLSG